MSHCKLDFKFKGGSVQMSRLQGGVLCAVASFLLMMSALHLSARESVWAGACVAAVALGLLLAAVASLKAGARKT